MILLWKDTSDPVDLLLKGQGQCPATPRSSASLNTGLCEPLWSVHLNCHLMRKLGMMYVFQAQVCSCTCLHPWLPHHKTNRETSGASKSQLNQARWNRTVLKIGSENQLNVYNYLSLFFYDSPLIARSGKSHHHQLDWACTAHLEYRSVVLKNLRITDTWICKI